MRSQYKYIHVQNFSLLAQRIVTPAVMAFGFLRQSSVITNGHAPTQRDLHGWRKCRRIVGNNPCPCRGAVDQAHPWAWPFRHASHVQIRSQRICHLRIQRRCPYNCFLPQHDKGGINTKPRSPQSHVLIFPYSDIGREPWGLRQ